MSYPVRVLSFGAGVQSSTLLRMAIVGDIEPIHHAVFADTGWEPAAVYKHMEESRELAEAHGIGFHIVSNGNIRNDILQPDRSYAAMPLFVNGRDGAGAMGRRQCTNEYKLEPLRIKQRELAGLTKGQRCTEHRITTIIGISLDELHRMKAPMFPWIVNEYPLVDQRMTRHDCLMYHQFRNLPRPPRSACIGCPYHSDSEWRHMRDNAPDEFEDAARFEEQLQASRADDPDAIERRSFLHAKRIPLRVVDFDNEEDRGQLSMFGDECEGMCGL